MKIAQVAPLFESVPPNTYGGTERVVSYLTEELVAMGHEVTLFASGDSITTARLAAVCERSLRLDGDCTDRMVHHIRLLERARKAASAFDLMHFHCDYLHYPLSRRMRTAHLTTLHGRLDLPELKALYEEFNDIPLVSISDAQRGRLGFADWRGTVYHGLPEEQYRFVEHPAPYFVFVGRISPEKQVDHAIEIARAAGTKLKIAAKVDAVDVEYFKQRIEPLLSDPLVEYLGELAEGPKRDLAARARALLFPINWPEPFGLVMIEAMAGGTPVLAYRRGSVPEVITHGVSGLIVDGLEEARQAVGAIDRLDRRRCRAEFESRFSARRMAADYVAIYERLVQERLALRQRIGPRRHAGRPRIGPSSNPAPGA